MKKQATFQIANSGGTLVTFFVADKGDSAGAAKRMLQAAIASSSNASMADAFLRTHLDASLTTGPQAHPNALYRYTLDHEHYFRAEHRSAVGQEWKLAWEGSFSAYIKAALDIKLMRIGATYADKAKAELRIMSRINAVKGLLDEDKYYEANLALSEAGARLRQTKVVFGETAGVLMARAIYAKFVERVNALQLTTKTAK